MVNLLENSGLRYKIIAKQLVNFMGVLVIASMMGLFVYYNFYCEAQARVRQGKARKGKERQGWRKVKGLKA